LGNTSINVTVGGATKQAIILGVNQNQINAIMPSSTPAGTGTLTVTSSEQTSAAAPVQVVSAAFGIFTYGATGVGQAIATYADYSINTIIHTFHPGDVGIIWGTGLGPINGSDAEVPPAGSLPGNVQVFVGNTAAQVTYHGRSGCCAGLDQVVFTVPQGVDGCYVPLSVQTSAGTCNFTSIAVSQSGNTCNDSIMGQDLITKLASGQSVSFGYVLLEDAFLKFVANSTTAANEDIASGTFSHFTPATAGLAAYGVSSGYCTVVACPGFACAVNSPFGLQDMSPGGLDAGSSLTAAWGNFVVQMPTPFSGSGVYFALLSLGSRYLWSQEPYNVSGAGGASVGAFNVTEETQLASTFITNLQPTQNIPRGTDFTVTWTGADPTKSNGEVVVAGYSGNNANYDLLSYYQCTAPGAAGQLTIPARVLSMIPASGTGQNGNLSYPLGWIWAGQLNNPTTFQATGLDKGIVTDAFYNGYGVYFQ
jgi:uncharacterized protein (TIGR03437 family)